MADEAALRHKQCQEGTITFDEYKAWLDDTSLQNKNRADESADISEIWVLWPDFRVEM